MLRPCDVVSERDLVRGDHRPKDEGVNIHERLVDAPAVPAPVFLQDRETERNPLLVELEEIVLVLVVILDAVALFSHAVWRVGENKVGALPVGCLLNVAHLQAVTAVKPVVSQQPEVAGFGEWFLWRRLGLGVAVLLFRLVIMQSFGQSRDKIAVFFLCVAAEHERDLAGVDVGENLGEHLVVSGGELRDAVVSRQIGQLLGLACVVLIVDRGVGQVIELRGHETAVALCDEPAALADSDRGAPARRSDDRGEELDLLRRVLVGVLWIGPQILQRDDGVVCTEHGDAAGVCLRRGRGAVLLDLGAGLRLRFIHGRHLLWRIVSRSTCGGWSPASCFGRQDGFSAVPVLPPRPPRWIGGR